MLLLVSHLVNGQNFFLCFSYYNAVEKNSLVHVCMCLYVGTLLECDPKKHGSVWQQYLCLLSSTRTVEAGGFKVILDYISIT